MVFKVSSDSVNLDPFTFVLGYNVRGRVQDGSSPVAGVEFLMSSEEGSPVSSLSLQLVATCSHL